MRYIVDVNGETRTLEVDSDEVRPVASDGTMGDLIPVTLAAVPGSPVWVLRMGVAVVSFVVRRRGAPGGPFTLVVDGERYEVEAANERSRAIRALVATAAPSHKAAVLRAPMPGLIVRIAVAVGERVAVGDRLVVMEAMKMENELRAPVAGIVRAVTVAAGVAVEKGALLVEIE